MTKMVDREDHSCDRSCVICGSIPGRKTVSKTRRSSSLIYLNIASMQT
ncbi:hypothetical protein NP493_215g04026 [Ridgeia piscesae]|uniref:Uncharacterized protein n=1 Tax=Ridgeia piscesae TaxID=27915 RepID=A0AAD9UE13_RIDPI|nr:hypothetical protein NP493_215g04026 [Ridgeia piscesae]